MFERMKAYCICDIYIYIFFFMNEQSSSKDDDDDGNEKREKGIKTFINFLNVK